MKNPLSFSIKFLYSALGLALLIGLVFFSVQSGQAGSTINVTITDDSLASDGECSLREAIIAANKDRASGGCNAGSSSGADTIILPNDLPGGSTFTLTRADNGKENASATGDLDVIDDTTIQGAGPGVTIVGVSGDHVFHVISGSVTIEDLTITGGGLPGNGGGIRNESQLTLRRVTINGNTVSGNGGGIYNAPSGTLEIINSTLGENSAGGSGGGLYNEGTVTLINNVTIAQNTANDGSGVANVGGDLNLQNTIVAGNLGSSDCSGTLTSGGHNLIQDASGCTVSGDTTTNLIGVSPNLGSLVDNGGNTFTYKPGDGSPAIDAGNLADPGSGGNACEQTDQRGALRPLGVACDIGAVEVPNAPVIIRAFPQGGSTTVVGRLSSTPDTEFTLNVYYSSVESEVCDPTSDGGQFAESIPVTTDSSGNVYFVHSIQSIPEDDFIVAAAVLDDGDISISDYSQCVRVGPGNDSWPRALGLPLVQNPNDPQLLEASTDQYLDLIDQSRWYSFTVQPYSKLIITLTDLPANYDLTVYKDIRQAFDKFISLNSNEDLQRLGAEFATDSFATDSFATDSFATDSFATDSFATDSFATDSFATDSFATDSFATDSFATDSFSTDSFATDSFATDSFATDSFAPEAFPTEAFASAQTRSLVAISAFNGLVGEGVLVNTWDSDTKFFVRVRGRNGAFDPSSPFHLDVKQYTGLCNGVNPQGLPASDLVADAGGYKTVILTNLAQMGATPEELADLTTRLDLFAARSEVQGVIVDVSDDARTTAAFQESENYPGCPAAQNNLAYSLKGLVDKYWALNDLEYVLIIGGDDEIPFFRHPDDALLANESNYIPPVLNDTISQSSLRLGNVLSQDNYGARFEVSYKNDAIPVPVLGVGRLVETTSDVITMLDAYMSDLDGVVVPNSSLVTGYDFLADAAEAVKKELDLGIGTAGDSLITDSWSADDLRNELLGERHDLIFLAGHFTGNRALAADFTTRMRAEEVADPNLTIDMTNVVVFSAGCHVAYNIVDPHAVPNLTRKIDWAQAFNSKGATLIGGTAYQYGDTDFKMYSEEIYWEFSEQLRMGTGPVSIGQALAKAKQAYLANTPFPRGIDEKAVLEATIFGFPMLSVDMPGERLTESSDSSDVTPMGFADNPGSTLGLEYADITVDTQKQHEYTVTLTDVNSSETFIATYFSWRDDEDNDYVLVKPNEPTLPLKRKNVSVTGTVLRGVGFRGGAYTDLPNILPFTGAAATEISGVHTPFPTNVFWPIKPYSVNYFDAVANGESGVTNLFTFPGQFKLSEPTSLTGIWRKFNSLDYRLYYSSNTTTYNPTLPNGDPNPDASTPALSAAPTIAVVSSQVGSDYVTFQARVVGNPAAGIQEVWVTYTGIDTEPSGELYGKWQSLPLTQTNPLDSTMWEETLLLPTGVTPDQVRYIVQAANGVGLVSMMTNWGHFYTPGAEAEPKTKTLLTLHEPEPPDPPRTGYYGSTVTLSATLTLSNGVPLTNTAVTLALGQQVRLGFTDDNGVATATLSNYALPGITQTVRATFAGFDDYQASFDTADFISQKQQTQISLNTVDGYPEGAAVEATLTDVEGHILFDDTLIFYVSGPKGTYGEALNTDYTGSATLENIPLPPGSYMVDVYFSGDIAPFGLILTDTRYVDSSISGAIILDNHVPVTTDDNYSVNEDEALIVDVLAGVLANDYDPDVQHSLTATLVSSTNNGLLNLNPDGSFSYAPNPDFNGVDSFTYEAYDGIDSVSALVTITVNPVNDAPVAVDNAYSVNEDGILNVDAPGVKDNDGDTDGDVLTVSLVSGTAKGSLILNADGSFSYDPNGQYEDLAVGETATDTFTYEACDPGGLCAGATVTITINGVNDAPTAVDNAYSTFEDTLLNAAVPGILDNDTDVDGDVLAVSAVNDKSTDVGQQITLTSGALLTVNADGSFSYNPNGQFDTLAQGETAADSFTYTISDGNGGSDTATVSITIDGVNDPPVCSTIVANEVSLWPPNNEFHLVKLSVPPDTNPDPNGDPVTLEIVSVFQNEPVGSEADAILYGDNTVDLRAERDGSGDGRVYHIGFVVDDGLGGTCSGDLHLGVVEHDQSGDVPVDSPHDYDSTMTD